VEQSHLLPEVAPHLGHHWVLPHQSRPEEGRTDTAGGCWHSCADSETDRAFTNSNAAFRNSNATSDGPLSHAATDSSSCACSYIDTASEGAFGYASAAPCYAYSTSSFDLDTENHT
jgi:hypothetical protein